MPDLTEREKQVVAWLRDEALDGAPKETFAPAWRHFLWAIFHPIRFARECGRFFALTDAADAIERGEHLRGGE